MPGASSDRPVDVQFGSLSLFDGQSTNKDASQQQLSQQK
jgi:hypothetical protein